MKNAHSNSLRTQQAVSEFGKAARHPLCQAWLRLREWQSESSRHEKDAAASLALLKRVEHQKKQARTLYEQLYKQGKQKEVIRVAALLRKISDHLEKLKTVYQAQVRLCAYSKEFRQHYDIRFVLECQRAERTKDRKALRALRYLKDTATESNVGQKRIFGILKMLQDKTIKATWAKDGAAAGYWEAGSGGDRPLSDEFWQGRFTVMDFRSGLEAMYDSRIAGDKEGKKVRRLLKGLGIQPAEGQVGRKLKGPCPGKQKPQQPLGRPPSKPDIVSTDELEAVRAMASQGKALFIKSESEDIDREIARLTRRRERLGIKEGKRNEGMIKGRSSVFARFVDSD